MNEKLKELAIQAKIQMVSEPRLQELFELIIAECIDAVEKGDCREMVLTSYDRSTETGIKQRCIKSIKQKFGIIYN